MHQLIASPRPGKVDIWKEYFDPDEDFGGAVRGESNQGIRFSTFLLYLCSPSTYGVRVARTNWNNDTRWAILEVYGPKCQDSKRLYVSFKLYKAQIEDYAANGGDVETMRKALKKHVKEDMPDFREKGRSQVRPLFNLYGLPYLT